MNTWVMRKKSFQCSKQKINEGTTFFKHFIITVMFFISLSELVVKKVMLEHEMIKLEKNVKLIFAWLAFSFFQLVCFEK